MSACRAVIVLLVIVVGALALWLLASWHETAHARQRCKYLMGILKRDE
jgi:Tfp pilus assembly protein PilV